MENLIEILTSIGLGVTIGLVCLLATYRNPFENLKQEIEEDIHSVEF